MNDFEKVGFFTLSEAFLWGFRSHRFSLPFPHAGNGFSEEGARALAEVLQWNTTIKAVNLACVLLSVATTIHAESSLAAGNQRWRRCLIHATSDHGADGMGGERDTKKNLWQIYSEVFSDLHGFFQQVRHLDG